MRDKIWMRCMLKKEKKKKIKKDSNHPQWVEKIRNYRITTLWVKKVWELHKNLRKSKSDGMLPSRSMNVDLYTDSSQRLQVPRLLPNESKRLEFA